MTPEQSKRFDELGCLPRSLLHLCEMLRKPKTKDEFCADFGKYFINQANDYGRIDAPFVFTVMQALPIPPFKGTHGDHKVIKQFMDAGHYALMTSEVNLNQVATDVINHCSVIEKIDTTEFKIWTPIADGTAAQMTLPISDWVDKKCIGVIF